MAITYYDTGTISLTSGSAVVTGIGTGWQTALIVGGLVCPQAAGNPLPIATVDSNTQITATIEWTGATGTYPYAIARQDDVNQVLRNAQALSTYLTRLDNDTLAALAAIDPVADTIPIFTGDETANVITLAELKELLAAGDMLKSVYDPRNRQLPLMTVSDGSLLSGFRNKIINGNFLVNQRGGTRTPGIGIYGFDRWKGHAGGLEQIVEALPAGTYTLTWAGGGNATIGNVTGVSPILVTVAAGNRSVVVPSNATRVSLVEGDARDELDTFSARHIQQELALCQRYYEKSYPSDVAPGSPVSPKNPYDACGLGIVSSDGGVRGQGKSLFSVEKRTIPSVRYWDMAGNLSAFTRGDNNGGFVEDNFAAGDPFRQVLANKRMIVAHCGTNVISTFVCQWEASAEL